MARLCAVTTGNNTSASTWALIDSTSFLESEANTITVPTVYATTYTQFTPGAITVDGIGLRVNQRVNTTGTFSTELYNHTAGASVAGTEVTVNMSDFVDASPSVLDGGWMFFKFSAPVTLLAANNYSVRFKTSNATQCVLNASTSTNPCRFLRTTTTQAPVAGDDRFIMGEWTAAGTMTSINVIPNDTVLVDYGSGLTALTTPALSISNGGSYNLTSPSAATTYQQKISGNVVVYSGGQIRIGTSSSRIPTDSSFTWTFDSASNADFVSLARRKGELTCYGESKTRWTTLTADVTAGTTVIPVASTSGWKAGDTLVFTATGTTTTHGETKTILTVDSATQVTLTSGLTNAHTGTGDVVGEVGNMTSNLKIVGVSQTGTTSITFKDSSIGVLDNVEVQYIGSSTTDKRGLEIQHTTSGINSATINSCVIRDYLNSGNALVGGNTGSGSNFYITNCLSVPNGGSATGITISSSNSLTAVFDVSNNLVTGLSASINQGIVVGIAHTWASAVVANNRIAGATNGVPLNMGTLDGATAQISGFKIHSCSSGVVISAIIPKIISNTDIVSCATGIGALSGVNTFNSCNIIGNSSTGISAGNNSTTPSIVTTFNDCIFRGRTSFAQPSGIGLNTGVLAKIIFNNCTFGQTTAHTTADINIPSLQYGTLILNNCSLLSTTEVNSTIHTFLGSTASVQIQRKDTTAGNHVVYVQQGVITPDTSIYRTASPSLRITPKSASVSCSTKLFGFKAFVNNGQACTPTVYVRESEAGDGAAYNGGRVRLYVATNYNAGITSDTLLDTATASSDGAWEALTGTTATVTDDVVLEFYVVCEGTTGWINVDDFTYTNA